MSDTEYRELTSEQLQAQVEHSLDDTLSFAIQAIEQALDQVHPTVEPLEIGKVKTVGQGVARVWGLPSVQSEELVRFESGVPGLVFNLDPDEVGIIVLGDDSRIHSGSIVRRTGRVFDVPVGEALLGRVINAAGRPLDDRGVIRTDERLPVEREAPPIMERAPVTKPMQTGLKVVDALLPIGRGQRELIVGDRQTGKTAIAIDAIINQRESDVICIYCAVGQRNAQVARTIDKLRQYGAMDYTVVMVAAGEEAPGLQWVAPYGATTIGEYFMEHGRDVLIIYDDLTRHARAYRELSLLLRRPPGREAFPGDIFYTHSRLLERSTHLRGSGGSLTALPIVETQAQNISAYIPTNLISITDGQIYLSPSLYQRGILPAVDVGQSVSRVGGDAQLPAYRKVSSDLRLSYSQFEELETFSRFGTRLDEQTRRQIERGRRVREIFKQEQYHPFKPSEQIIIMLAVNHGLFDSLDLAQIDEAQAAIREYMEQREADFGQRIEEGMQLQDEDIERLLEIARKALSDLYAQSEPDEMENNSV